MIPQVSYPRGLEYTPCHPNPLAVKQEQKFIRD